MNIINILVTLAGCALIGWIIWYFWLWKGEAVTAVAHASGRQEVDVTVKGGYL
jgi:plastocyanin domain-containing protein